MTNEKGGGSRIPLLAERQIDLLLDNGSPGEVLFLGESMHGVSEYAVAKHEIISAAFNRGERIMVLLEAGHLESAMMPDYLRAGEFEEGMRRILYPVFWSHEIREMLVSLAAMLGSGSPVTIVGIDCRPGGPGETPMQSWLQRHHDSCVNEWKRAEEGSYDLSRKGYVQGAETRERYHRIRDDLASMYSGFADLFADDDRIGTISPRRVIRQRIGLIEAIHDAHSYFHYRDRVMAENIAWTTREYPDADRYIVLTHNEHARGPRLVSDEPDTARMILDHLTDHPVRSIGMYECGGSGLTNNGRRMVLERVPDHFLEGLVRASSTEEIMLLGTRDVSLPDGPFSVREFGTTELPVTLGETFDEIIIFREVHAPDPLV